METENICEIWRNAPGFEGLYQASTLGRIKSLDRCIQCRDGKSKHLKGKLLKTKLCGFYDAVPMCSKNHYVHIVIAKTFPEICGKWFEGCQVDHIDTNIHNNKASNLRVGTEAQNHNNPLTRKHNSEAKTGSAPWNKGKNYKCPGISNSLKGKYCGSSNPNAKPILQLTLNGEVVREWDCIKSAAEHLGITPNGISQAIKNVSHHTAGGYRWQYK